MYFLRNCSNINPFLYINPFFIPVQHNIFPQNFIPSFLVLQEKTHRNVKDRFKNQTVLKTVFFHVLRLFRCSNGKHLARKGIYLGDGSGIGYGDLISNLDLV